MKKAIVLVFILFSISASAQDSIQEFNPIMPFFRISILNHNQFGNYSLSKDFESDAGINMAFSLFTVKNFSLVGGFHANYYKITNQQNVGIINSLFFRSLYVEIDYKIPLKHDISVIPLVSYGYVHTKYKTGSRKFGVQEGNEFKIGTLVDYKLIDFLSVFGGVNYALTHLNVETNREYVSYFGKANRMEFQIGLKIGY